MKIKDKIVVITGAAQGIGAAMAECFATAGAAGLVLCDLDSQQVGTVAQALPLSPDKRLGMRCDVAVKEQVEHVVSAAIQRFGRIDMFCSNAGIIVTGDERTPVADWQKAWDINVMAHVHAASAVLPSMLERGEGYLLNTVSAAGLLTSPGAAPYAVSKHAALAFSEWLSITYGNSGIGVSALCPQAIRTKMIEDAIASGAGGAVASGGDMLEPAQVARQALEGVEAGRFLILSHPETQRYVEAKASNVDRWISGMRKFVSKA